MKTTIYIDVLFCVNLIIDYVMLLSVQKIMAFEVRQRRLLLGAVIGGIGSFAVLLPPLPMALSAALSFALCLGMTAAAFMPMSFSRMLKSAAALFTVSFLYCGVMTAVLALLSPKNLTVRNSVVYIGIHPLILIALTLICYGGLRLFYSLRGEGTAGHDRCSVKIRLGEKTIVAEGLTDTGNSLHEPFSGECVVVMKSGFCHETENVTRLIGGNIENMENIGQTGKTVRMIPFRSLGGSGVMPAIRPTEMIITVKNKEIKVSAYLAFSDEANFSEGCDCIVPAELIRKGC